MKKWVIPSFFLFLFSFSASAQWVWAPLNKGQAADETYLPSTRDIGFFANGINSYGTISDTTESVDGNGAFNIKYHVEAYDFWGGYVVRAHFNDLSVLGRDGHYDLSNGKYISFWIKVTGQAVKDQPGDVNFEFKLKEKRHADTGEDRWLYNAGPILDAPAGNWQQIIVPLDQWHFSAQANDENGEWEPWNIYGWEIAVVYISAGNSTQPPAATGSFLMDKIQILGQRYEPLMSFDNQADTTYDPIRKPAFWTVNPFGPTSFYSGFPVSLSNENQDSVEGDGCLGIAYNLVSDDTWPGIVSLNHEFSSPVHLGPDLSSVFNKMVFYLKTIEPSSMKDKFFLKISLGDEKDGKIEFWDAVPEADFNKETGWQYIELPFQFSEKSGRELLPGDKGWALREKTNDGLFDLERIKSVQFQLILYRKDNFPPGGVDAVVGGKFLIDLMTGSGFLYEHGDPPAGPGMVAATALETGKNLILWEDNPGEIGEYYTVFRANHPITDLTDPTVKIVATGIPEDRQSAEHLFNYPLDSKNLKFWYAVLCTDKYGNVDSTQFGTTDQPTENDARPVPIVLSETSFGFQADGDLSEWSRLQPWDMKPSNGTGTIITQLGSNNGDQDLSAKIWINFSDDSLFIALHVFDNIVFTDTTAAAYNQDAVEFFFGAYEYRGADHRNYSRGEKPDYHFMFNSNRVLDGLNGKTITGASSPDYQWKKVSDGYNLEWKISWADLALTHPGDKKFEVSSCSNHWCDFWQVPIDWVINDADETGSRESGLRWAQVPWDNAWQNVASWTYTFLYVPLRDGVEDTEMPNRLTLQPNYPNPFNPETTIRYNLPVSGFVSLSLYDITGREVKKLVSGFQPAGEKSIQFNGSGFASGLYFLNLRQSGKMEVQKLMLLK